MTTDLPTGLTWRKSSLSADNGTCVEVANLPADFMWRKSTLSTDNGACVQVAPLPGELVAVRDSKNPAGGHLVIGKHLLLTLATSR